MTVIYFKFVRVAEIEEIYGGEKIDGVLEDDRLAAMRGNRTIPLDD